MSKKDVLKIEIERLAKLIKASEHLLPTFDYSEDFARPHIEIEGREYNFVIVERGQELKRKKTFEIKEILFWIFDAVTFSMACDLELKNRKEDEDSRIQLFKIQEDLIYQINFEYSEILKTKHSKLLNL